MSHQPGPLTDTNAYFSIKTFMECSDLLRCHFIHGHAEKYFLYIQNPHGLTVLTILVLALCTYPKLSKAKMKMEKMIHDVSSESLLRIVFAFLNKDCLAQERHRELKLVWLESSGHEDSEYVINTWWHVCEHNCNAKHLATPFSAARDPMSGEGDCGIHMAIGSENSDTSGILQKL